MITDAVEPRPVCFFCHQSVQWFNWALTPYKPPRQEIALVVTCLPKCVGALTRASL